MLHRKSYRKRRNDSPGPLKVVKKAGKYVFYINFFVRILDDTALTNKPKSRVDYYV
jgi:hypothetical protein